MAAILRLSFTPQPLQRVRVNLNAITEDGLVRIRADRFQRPPRPGMHVVVFEPTDEIEGFAMVTCVNDRTGLAYLDVAWDSLRDASPLQMTVAASSPASATGPRSPLVPRAAV